MLVMDRERAADYQAMVAELRAVGVRAEMYMAEASLKSQMRYADKRSSPCVVIQGSNERERGTVILKDLVEGKKLSSLIASNQEWRGSHNVQTEIRRGTSFQRSNAWFAAICKAPEPGSLFRKRSRRQIENMDEELRWLLACQIAFGKSRTSSR